MFVCLLWVCLLEAVAQPHLEKFFSFSTFSMLPRKPHIAKDMKHSSRLENDKNASHFPSREVVQQSLLLNSLSPLSQLLEQKNKVAMLLNKGSCEKIEEKIEFLDHLWSVVTREGEGCFHIVRHGQSTANLKRVIAGGGYDVSLTKKGEDQARKVGEKIVSENLKYDYVFVSSQQRARQTLSAIRKVAKSLPQEFIVDRLKEREFGCYTGISYEDIPQEMKTNITYQIEGGESILEMERRVRPVFNLMDHLVKKGYRILVVGHSYSLGVGLLSLCGVEKENWLKSEVLPNAQLLVLNQEKGQYTNVSPFLRCEKEDLYREALSASFLIKRPLWGENYMQVGMAV